ncbi:tetratricopeptide repeat protein [Achromobacter deleyi]|uniref:tetratricopeptide repeat protein n=1 Tax=Achromobacter deleyi TaxID=1353891 RepID=UPI0014915281|nr:tetratricopeptide repeat protein [Achromobacter deleyi]QVQ27070.1 tetratricopeptide repeat protein [Achromobacter deleyi]UIP22655.1 tetratricopeptide repeat protein [Achromobacter deleyi]
MGSEFDQNAVARAAQAFQQGDYALAAKLLAPAVAANPDNANLVRAQAITLSRLNQLDAAADCFDQAVRLEPDDVALLSEAGKVNLRAGRLEAALGHFRAARRRAPQDAAMLGRVINVMLKLQHADQAIALVDEVLAKAPRSAPLHYMRGVALGAMGRRGDERLAYETALKLDPRLVDAHTNLGVLARDEHRFEDALRHFKQALSIDPDHAGARNNRAQTNLLLGRYAHGWRDYEWRWRDGEQKMPHEGAPWLGESSLQGLTLLVHAEQGLGDTLQFSRYVPALAAQAEQLIFQVQPSLERLLRDNLPGITVISRDAPVPAFDRHVPLLSLPLAMSRTRPDPWPLERPLQADAELVREWAGRLEQQFGMAGARPRIGLAWSGNPQHPDDRNRSIPFARIAALLKAPCDFVCVQKDLRADDLAAIEQWRHTATGGRLHLASDALRDFSDSAALMANLDRVISVDTATAHLAGALGVSTCLLLPSTPDWRWLLDRADTPWYGSVALYRKPADGGWDKVLDDVLEGLA